jgi:hypothetical protein
MVLVRLECPKDGHPAVRGDSDRKGWVEVNGGRSSQRSKGVDRSRGNKDWGHSGHGRSGDLRKKMISVDSVQWRG